MEPAMSRFMYRFLAVLAAPLALALVFLATSWMRNGPLTGVLAMFSAAPADSTRYCYAWQALNQTGQDANDLHIGLKSVVNVSQVYTGTLNPFGLPANSSGYDGNADVYHLDYISATVDSADIVNLGLCTDHAKLQLDPSITSAQAFYWTQNGVPLTSTLPFVGLDWDWKSRYHLHLGLINSNAFTVTMQSLLVLDPGYPLMLEDLNGDVLASQSPVSDLANGDVVLLPPGVSTYFDLYFDSSQAAFLPNHAPLLEPNHPYVIQAIFSTEDDLSTTWELYSQSLSPFATMYLPVVRR
jgi:hypothetical protein